MDAYGRKLVKIGASQIPLKLGKPLVLYVCRVTKHSVKDLGTAISRLSSRDIQITWALLGEMLLHNSQTAHGDFRVHTMLSPHESGEKSGLS